jgi:hypothetical protein
VIRRSPNNGTSQARQLCKHYQLKIRDFGKAIGSSTSFLLAWFSPSSSHGSFTSTSRDEFCALKGTSIKAPAPLLQTCTCVRFSKSEEQSKVKLSYEEVHKFIWWGHDVPKSHSVCGRIRIRYDKRNPGEDLKIWVEIGAQDRRSEFRDCCYHGLKNMICASVSHFLALPSCLLLCCCPVQKFSLCLPLFGCL